MERWDLAPDLPHEVVYDILSRLPVKPLCRFKSVSKSWLALITDPHFIKSHLHQSMKSNTNQKLILGPPRWVHIHSPFSMDYQAPRISEPPPQISEPSYSLDYQAPDPTPAELEMPWKSGVVETIWALSMESYS
ncbi:hypothetical protein RHMOL_Rhmol04G0342200 [Rhododendron molle]|uniref:Uncharacterized protein n=1 Tax=Rhododendron molle TaxID=49168 RepID=A0ACC0P8H8_RHOML|nr:hypothetical protein RHMOL_Rhmol04G0342200 [Rhododendron molle]